MQWYFGEIGLNPVWPRQWPLSPPRAPQLLVPRLLDRMGHAGSSGAHVRLASRIANVHGQAVRRVYSSHCRTGGSATPQGRTCVTSGMDSQSG